MGSVPLVTQDNPSANDFPYSARASDTTKFACFLKRFQHSLNRCLGNRQFCCQLPDGQTRITCYGIYYQRFIVRIVLTIVRIVLTRELPRELPRKLPRKVPRKLPRKVPRKVPRKGPRGQSPSSCCGNLLWQPGLTLQP